MKVKKRNAYLHMLLVCIRRYMHDW